MTTTERRLAITPGRLVHDEDGATVEISEAHENDDYNFVVADFFDPTGDGCANDNARLFLNAHTVYNSCHLTPSELLAELSRLRQERDDLVGALEEIRSIPLFANSDAEHVLAVQRIAKTILSKHKPE